MSTGTQAARYSLSDDAWELLTIPATLEDSTVESIFGKTLPVEEYGRTWAVFTYEVEDGRYRSPLLSDELVPGEAFWIRQKTGKVRYLQVSSGSDLPVDTSAACPSPSGCFRQPLETSARGVSWHLVGAPFDADLPVDDLRWVDKSDCAAGCTLAEAAAKGYTSAGLWGYDAEQGNYASHAATDQLPVWRGAWLPVGPKAHGSRPALLMPVPAPVTEPSDIHALNKALGRGINLGNALEALNEGEYGLTLEADYFTTIAQAGFDSVRVPVRWSAHAATDAPYTIDPAFFERIDWVIRQAHSNRLRVIINMHHFDELMADPAGQRSRYLAMWQQIAQRYAGQPDTVYFELLNEPFGAFNDEPELWNELLAVAVERIRRTNPQRALLVGPVAWNVVSSLDTLRLPPDPNLIATVHYYEPFGFTHQGAEWMDSVPAGGISWQGDQLGLGGAFQNWSWETRVSAEGSTLRISYERQYAGFNVWLNDTQRPDSLMVETSGDVDVDILCGSNNNFRAVGAIKQAGTEWMRHQVSLADCDDDAREITLQNVAGPEASFRLRQGEVCTASGCHGMLATASEVIDQQLDAAARWGQANDRPIHVGEFGAYHIADMTSRADWTATVVAVTTRKNMSSAYWEFASGFGAWDPTIRQWQAPLLDALLSPATGE